MAEAQNRKFAGVIHAGISDCTVLTGPRYIRTYDSFYIFLKNCFNLVRKRDRDRQNSIGKTTKLRLPHPVSGSLQNSQSVSPTGRRHSENTCA